MQGSVGRLFIYTQSSGVTGSPLAAISRWTNGDLRVKMHDGIIPLVEIDIFQAHILEDACTVEIADIQLHSMCVFIPGFPWILRIVRLSYPPQTSSCQ